MPFEPINDDHAVEQCQFAIGFHRSFSPSTFDAIEASQFEWASLLPASTRVADSDFENSQLPLATPRGPFGLLYAQLRPDGSAVWDLRIFRNQIDVTCTRYSRWDGTLATATKFVARILEIIATTEENLRLYGTALRVLDRFETQRGYNLSELVLRGQLVPDRMFGVGDTWHAHLGSFEDDPLGSILEKVEFDAIIRRDRTAEGSEEEKVNLLLEHFQQHRFKAASSSEEFELNEKSITIFSDSMWQLHHRNKKLLQTNLQPGMLDRIGLSEAK